MLAINSAFESWPVSATLNILFMFKLETKKILSHGSGWSICRIDRIVLKMVKSAPIRGSSYLPLLADLLKYKRFLLNIRNYEDDRCFEYCFLAEYQRQNNIPLTLRTMQSKEEERANFYDYRRNSKANEPTGDFVFPMGPPTYGRFKIHNEVQLNVSGLVAFFSLLNFLIGANLYLSTSEQIVGLTFVEELLL